MKIAKVIRDAYDQEKVNYTRLSEEVCAKIRPKVEVQNWFFIHRIKEVESFALKIETGRVQDPLRMDDFFACTIIVPNIPQISDAEQLILNMYELAYRRPKDAGITDRRASEFVFDDLRLYLKRGTSETGRNEDLEDLVFEVQIKTVLQYAWGIASHDLIYKTDNVSWPKERIAFQVKAMLEHAEIAIAEAERLADSPAISKKDERTTSTLEIIQVIRSFWSADQLPRDIKRLAESMGGVLKACGIKSSGLQDFLQMERNRVGLIPTNLSPYAFLVQALAHSDKIDFRAKITSNKDSRTKILVHRDMDLPDWLSEPSDKIIRL